MKFCSPTQHCLSGYHDGAMHRWPCSLSHTKLSRLRILVLIRSILHRCSALQPGSHSAGSHSAQLSVSPLKLHACIELLLAHARLDCGTRLVELASVDMLRPGTLIYVRSSLMCHFALPNVFDPPEHPFTPQEPESHIVMVEGVGDNTVTVINPDTATALRNAGLCDQAPPFDVTNHKLLDCIVSFDVAPKYAKIDLHQVNE